MEPLDLSHQKLIESNISSLDVLISEYTFANLFLFRKTHEYFVLQNEHGIFIKGKTYDGTLFLMPTVKLIVTEALLQMLEKEGAYCFFPIPEEWLLLQDETIVTHSFLDMDSDYLFERTLLAAYPGRLLSKKRNLVRQFVDEYGLPTAAPLGESNKEDALAVLEKWKEQAGIEADFEASKEAILLASKLGLQGFVYFIEGVPAGLSIGEPLGKSVFVIHFAKADKTYKGIYQYMYQDLAKRVSYAWINMEQDLGYPELKQSKHSYQPKKILKKYRLQEKTLHDEKQKSICQIGNDGSEGEGDNPGSQNFKRYSPANSGQPAGGSYTHDSKVDGVRRA
jgi:hypothetical protein